MDPDEIVGLIPSWIATRADLNEVEQHSIIDGLSRRRWQHPSLESLLDDMATRRLHADMFGSVWTWAGKYRLTERNIGVDPIRIAVCVRDLMEDARWWCTPESTVGHDEAAYRFHHRLVQIHAFPNGNGRHARAMTDLLLGALNEPPFTWGRTDLNDTSHVRATYIEALRAADTGDFRRLAAFVRS